MPIKFSTRALARSHGWDAWLPWQELPLPNPQQRHPRALRCPRAYQLPKTGECPSQQLPHNAHVAGWRPGPLSEGHPSQTLPTRPTALRAPHTAGHPCPLRYTRPHMDPWPTRPTSPVPGVPTQRNAPFAATLPTGQQGSCTPPNRVRAYTPTNSKTTSIL